MPFRIESLTFNDGSTVSTADADVIVLLGPNNAGKSRTLQEIQAHLSAQPGQQIDPRVYVVVPKVSIQKDLDAEQLRSWIRQNRYIWTEPSNLADHFRTHETANTFSDVEQHWQQPDRLGILTSHLVRTLWCGERLGHMASPSKLNPGMHPEHAVQWLVANPDRLEAFRRSFHAAFGMNVIVDGWANNIFLRVSDSEQQQDFATETTDGFAEPELWDRLNRLQTIDAQSDGVRSFAGIVLTLLASQYPLVLLDEPEAFLHPPQARLLGRSLGTLQRGGQLFVATHSLDILLGLVSAAPSRVKIVRLTRTEGRTSPKVLESDQVAALWKDPLLRFSRALDGLFHDGVVVGEGDTDSQFYSAVADEHQLGEGRHVMYAYAGGKQRIPLVATALNAVGVPVRAVVDFDILREEARLEALVTAVGGVLSVQMKSDRSVVEAQLRGNEAPLSVGTARGRLSDALGTDDEALITTAMRSAARSAFEQDAGWPLAKKIGQAAVPNGEATAAVQRLLADLRMQQVFVVPSGAVESLVRDVGGHGPRWVGEVIEKGKIASAEEARDFVRDILDSLPGGRVEAARELPE